MVPLGLAGFVALAGSPVIVDAERSPGGKMRLAMAADPGAYFVLRRHAELANRPGRAVALAEGSAAQTWLADSAYTKKGHDYLHVEVYDRNNPGDLDNDGLDDLLELALPGRFNPLNPAPRIDDIYGTVQLPTRAEFERLSNRDNRPGAQSVREVKFLIFNVDTNRPELYFSDSNRHEFHFFFAREIGRYLDNTLFNNDSYFSSNRKNLVGSLISHDNFVGPDGRSGMYTVEFWPTDPIPFRHIETAYEMIAASMPFVDGNIAYHPASETQRERMRLEAAAFDASQVSRIATETLFGNVSYTGLHEAESFGRLRLVTGAETLSVRDIVIFRTIPNDLTHVSGIMTEIPQTPLSHINLKAKQNDTPNAFIANAAIHPEIAPLIGQNVYYRVGPDGFEIRAASQAEVDAWFQSIRPTTDQIPVRDLTATTIQSFAQLGFADASAVGSKAANVAELNRILPANSPSQGFAVPFYFYDEFMKHNGFYTAAQAMIADPVFQADATTREQFLKIFRTNIENGILPVWMRTALADMHAQFPVGSSVRARSSTNNEDLAGFSGAGLYSSFTHKPSEGHFEKSAKQVWASLWNYRAFEERAFWRIDHLAAAMGILVHPNYKDEQANGVGVTKNIYDPRWRGHYINVQLGEDLVTNPNAESIPEEFLISSLATATYEIQYIRFSNQVPDGTTILTEPQAQDLKDKMNTIHFHFKSLYGIPPVNQDWAMEIEFKITAAGQLEIKQARPWID